MAGVGLNENVQEVADSWFINGISADNDNSPGLQRLKIGGQELLATKIPTTLSARVDLAARVENLGVLKKASISLVFYQSESRSNGSKSTYDCHVWINLDTEVVEIRISVPLEHTNTMAD